MEEDLYKRPKSIVPYTTKRVEDDAPLTFYQIGALAFGVVALLFKLKWACWISLFALFGFIANMKLPLDYKQILTTAGFE